MYEEFRRRGQFSGNGNDDITYKHNGMKTKMSVKRKFRKKSIITSCVEKCDVTCCYDACDDDSRCDGGQYCGGTGI